MNKPYNRNAVLTTDDVNGLSQNSEVLAFHLRSVSKDRLTKKVVMVPNEVVESLKQL